ncbi:MAG TPA: hypothetical protein VFZ34_20705 [Blastocatellia bacterium]|nr:hypothetical protein [Blastocatellia bacterium]
MPVIFYQSNFCPECGNAATQRRWWQHRYFCEYCAEKLGRKWDWLPLAFLIGGLALGALFTSGRREVIREVAVHQPTPPFNQPSLPLVSAQDATAQLKPIEFTAPAVTYQCGARTQRGTACKHRVAVPGQRCFQHQGRRSILK